MRQNIAHHEVNSSQRKTLRFELKKAKRLAADGKKAEIMALLPRLQQLIDKATKNHLLHPNNAAHKKSALAKLVASK